MAGEPKAQRSVRVPRYFQSCFFAKLHFKYLSQTKNKVQCGR